jgi:hypothetical protein
MYNPLIFNALRSFCFDHHCQMLIHPDRVRTIARQHRRTQRNQSTTDNASEFIPPQRLKHPDTKREC